MYGATQDRARADGPSRVRVSRLVLERTDANPCDTSDASSWTHQGDAISSLRHVLSWPRGKSSGGWPSHLQAGDQTVSLCDGTNTLGSLSPNSLLRAARMSQPPLHPVLRVAIVPKSGLAWPGGQPGERLLSVTNYGLTVVVAKCSERTGGAMEQGGAQTHRPPDAPGLFSGHRRLSPGSQHLIYGLFPTTDLPESRSTSSRPNHSDKAQRKTHRGQTSISHEEKPPPRAKTDLAIPNYLSVPPKQLEIPARHAASHSLSFGHSFRCIAWR